MDHEAAPPAADVEHALALAQRELPADELELGLLRLLERLGPAREVRAAVGHRAIEEQREELVADVVVVAHGAAVARDRVPLARAAAARSPAAAAGPPARRRGPARAPSRACCAERERRRLELVDHPQRGVEVVHLDHARRRRPGRGPARRARAARGRAPAASASVNVGASGSVARHLVPSQKRSANGRRGSAPVSASPERSRLRQRHGSAATPAPRPAPCRSRRAGFTRTTSHARPVISISRMIAADGSICQRRRPWRYEHRERVVVVVPRLAPGGDRQPGEVARLVVGVVVLPAEEVAQRVDAERGVVHEEDPRRPAPQQRGQPAGHGAASARRRARTRRRAPRSPTARTCRRRTGSADRRAGPWRSAARRPPPCR